MEVVPVTKEQLKQLRADQERHELEDLRATVRINSLTDTRERFQDVALACETALRIYEEAIVNLAEDDLDDFETAKAKAGKMEKLEREFGRLVTTWENQLRRMNWEAREARQSL